MIHSVEFNDSLLPGFYVLLFENIVLANTTG